MGPTAAVRTNDHGAAQQAIFESGDATQVYVAGDRLGALRIVDIERVSVTVEWPQSTQTLGPPAMPALFTRRCRSPRNHRPLIRLTN